MEINPQPVKAEYIDSYVINKVTLLSDGQLKSEPYKFPTELPPDWASHPKGVRHGNVIICPLVKVLIGKIGFEIDTNSPIGTGTYGRVYRGKRLSNGAGKAFDKQVEQVSVKITDLSKVSIHYKTHFLPRENLFLNTVSGEHLVETFETIVGQVVESNTDKLYYIVIQEYLEHELFNLVYKPDGSKRQLPLAIIKRTFVQMCHGVMQMHRNGVCHRDLKISNMMLTSNRFVLKVIDFGMLYIRVSNNDSNNKAKWNLTDTLCGTKKFLSPELVFDDDYLPQLYDSWLLGLVLLELVNSTVPDLYEKMKQKGSYDQAWIKLDEDIPNDVKNVIMGFLQIESKRVSIEEFLNTNRDWYSEVNFWSKYDSKEITNVYEQLQEESIESNNMGHKEL